MFTDSTPLPCPIATAPGLGGSARAFGPGPAVWLAAEVDVDSPSSVRRISCGITTQAWSSFQALLVTLKQAVSWFQCHDKTLVPWPPVARGPRNLLNSDSC